MRHIINTLAKWAFAIGLTGTAIYMMTRPGFNLQGHPEVVFVGIGAFIAFVVAAND